MRLLTTKIWRAFPELDPFTDDQCRVYIRQAKRARWKWGLLWAFAGIVVGVLATIAFFIAFGFAIELFGEPDLPDWGDWLLIVTTLVITFGTTPLFALFARDLWLRRAVRTRIDTARCLCGYSLLGLTPRTDPKTKGQFVLCPECGMPTVLDDAGLSAADLAVGTDTNPVGPPDILTRRLRREGIAPASEQTAQQALEQTTPRRARIAGRSGWIAGLLVASALGALLLTDLVEPVRFTRSWVIARYYQPAAWFSLLLVAYLIGLIVTKIVRNALDTRAIRTAARK